MPGVAAGHSDVCKAWLLGTVMYARRGCWAQCRMQGVATGRSDACKAVNKSVKTKKGHQ